MVRAPCCEKTGLKRGTWTQEEDQRLKAYIDRYGYGNWRALPKKAGLLRCGKSCRLRWMNYLRPDIKRGNYSREEEETIINVHQSLGNRWSAIAARLPGRTDNEIKNYWHTHLKKHLHEYSVAPQTKQKSTEMVECNAEMKKAMKPITTKPKSAIMHFKSEYPCHSVGSPRHSSTNALSPWEDRDTDGIDSLKTFAELSDAEASSALEGFGMLEDFVGTFVASGLQFPLSSSCYEEDQNRIRMPNDTKEFWLNMLMMETGEPLEI